MSITKWRNNALIPGFNDWVDNFFNREDDVFSTMQKGLTVPAVNVLENKDSFDLEVAAPGMNKGDFKVEVDRGVLTISATSESSTEKKEKDYTRQEFSYHSFKRSFWLPENVVAEDIGAKYEDGLLRLSIPKAKAQTPQAAKLIKVA